MIFHYVLECLAMKNTECFSTDKYSYMMIARSKFLDEPSERSHGGIINKKVKLENDQETAQSERNP